MYFLELRLSEVCESRDFRLIGTTAEQDHELHFDYSRVGKLGFQNAMLDMGHITPSFGAIVKPNNTAITWHGIDRL
jgi:hypothetical protein